MADEDPTPSTAPADAPAAPEKKAPVRPRKPRAAAAKGEATPATASSAPAKTPAPRPRKAVAPPPLAKPSARPPAGPPATVIDASGLVLGRAASLIAQRLLKGESIVVVRAEQTVIIGNRANILSFYTANRARGSKRTGPHFPRYPDRIFRRTVRGMLPHLKTRGKLAFDRLTVHIGCPDGIHAQVPEWVGAAKARPALRTPLTLGEVSRLLGARV